MSKTIKIFTLILFSFLLCFLTYRLCYFITETYFFDKLFYQKSTKYGYWKTEKIRHSDFGDRAKDIITLQNNNNKLKITPIFTKNKTFNIIVIGDSYTWGQGVENKNRFVYKLQNRLNKIRPTKIYSLGNGGDNIFDNYNKYQQSKSIFGIADLYIFAFVSNDLLYNPDNRYGTNEKIIEPHVKYCPGPAIFDYVFNEPMSNTLKISGYDTKLIKTLDPSSQNYCLFQKIATSFPKVKTIYINLEKNIFENSDINEKFHQLTSNYFSVLTLPKQLNGNSSLYVSNKERHPSVITHQIYANALYTEITTNSEWGFIK